MVDSTNTAMICPTDEIAAYIDGELASERELQLEAHFATCGPCLAELNEQKQFLCDLDRSLKDERDLELPPDFTRLVVANAESTVSGLRRPRERFNAMFICAALALFGLFALGSDAGTIANAASGVIEQTAAVGSFFGGIVYSFFVGVTVVVRSMAAPFAGGTVAGAVIVAIVAASLMLVSRKVLRLRRA